MRLASRSLPLLLALIAAVPSAARADEMDVTVARLSNDAPAGMDCNGAPRADGSLLRCPDAEAWTNVVSQLGFSMAPPILSPARTRGFGGFQIMVEGWMTGIDSDEDYWERGTEGDASAGREGRNRFVDSILWWNRLVVRKGFPFGLELGLSGGQLMNSSYWTWGLEVKLAIFEGYRTGLGGFIPDIAIRGMAQTLTGESEFNLTVPSLDVTVSKPITVAGTGTITPFLVWQLVWIFGDSELVDLTPDTSAFDTCSPLPGELPVQCAGSGSDFENNVVFPQVRANRQRLSFGVQGKYEWFTGTASFAFDMMKPADADDDVSATLPRQWTVAAGVGLSL